MGDEPKSKRRHAEDLRALAKLAVDATTGVTGVVEDMHRTIASGPAWLGRPLAKPARLWTVLAYGHVRLVTRLVGKGVDRVLEEIAPLLGESEPGAQRAAVIAVLNGVLGDYLAELESPLAIAMGSRIEGEPSSKVVVLVHGSSMSDLQWTRRGHDHGVALARDRGFTPVYIHYNSGLHISTNGRLLADHLEEVVARWPVPVDELVLLGHSMGGLVSRSACAAAEQTALGWRKKLTKLVTIGTPHHGAALERGGNWLDTLLPVTSYTEPLARLGRIRSAGVTDLRFGNVLDEHWEGRSRFAMGPDSRSALPLPAGVLCYAIAGTTASDPGLTQPPGDGLVSIDSAFGRHSKESHCLTFAETHLIHGAAHLDLLDRGEAYEALKRWL